MMTSTRLGQVPHFSTPYAKTAAAGKEPAFPAELKDQPPTPLRLCPVQAPASRGGSPGGASDGNGGGGPTWWRPAALDDLLRLRAAYPDARVVAGNSEVGIESRYKNHPATTFLFAGGVPELKACTNAADGMQLGACAPLSDIEAFCHRVGGEAADAIAQMLRWFASTQIRNVACLGGNIVTASPISDMIPLLVSLDARLTVASAARGSRTVAMKSFFLGYRKVDLQLDEMLVSIKVPHAAGGPTEFVMPFKQARRREDDISIVTGGLRVALTPEGGAWKVASASFAFGGLAPTVVTAPKAAAALVGKPWDGRRRVRRAHRGAARLGGRAGRPARVPFGAARVGALQVLRRHLGQARRQGRRRRGRAARAARRRRRRRRRPLVGRRAEAEGRRRAALPARELPGPRGRPDAGHRARGRGGGRQGGRRARRRRVAAAPAGAMHVTGEAEYTDDAPSPPNTLHGWLIRAEQAPATLTGLDLSAASEAPGVVRILTAADLPSGGINSIGPIMKDELCFASDLVEHVGQVIGIVVAATAEEARVASTLVKVGYGPPPPGVVPCYTIDDAIANKSFFDTAPFGTDHDLENGPSVDEALRGRPRRGERRVPDGRPGALLPRVQHDARVADGRGRADGPRVDAGDRQDAEDGLARDGRAVPQGRRQDAPDGRRLRRQGDAHRLRLLRGRRRRAPPQAPRPPLAPPRRRHGHLGRPPPLCRALHGGARPRGGRRRAQARGTRREALLQRRRDARPVGADRRPRAAPRRQHLQVAVFRAVGVACKTHTPPNTAFRGFGGPQGLMVAEHIIEHLAPRAASSRTRCARRTCTRRTTRSPLASSSGRRVARAARVARGRRRLQRRGAPAGRRRVQRGQQVAQARPRDAAHQVRHQLHRQVHEPGRRARPPLHGRHRPHHARRHRDGAGPAHQGVPGGARAFGVPLSACHVAETSSDKVANTMPTAASASTDLYAMATLDACRQILARLEPIRAKHPKGAAATLADLALTANFERVDLSAHGFFAIDTKRCGFDWNMRPGVKADGTPDQTARGHPFNYFTQGVGCVEVEIDVLTGDHEVRRTDLLVDLGSSINPALDIGQIEGAFVQGMGWTTTEELMWGDGEHKWVRPPGRLHTSGPGTYKLPAFNDTPRAFNVRLMSGVDNKVAVHSSKAVGEPPFFLGAGVFFAIRKAVAAARAEHAPEAASGKHFTLLSPATTERIRMACADKFAARAMAKSEEAPKDGDSLKCRGSF